MDGKIQTSLGPKNAPWNKGRITGQKRPLKPKDVWAIRIRLQLKHQVRDLALFILSIDSKLRGCDLVRLQVEDVCAGGRVRDRATIIQKKTGRPVQFEITEQTRAPPGLASEGRRERRQISFPEPFPGATAPLDTAVCTDCARLGRERRARRLGLRHALNAADEGGPDLQEDWQSAGGSASPRSYQARKHSPLSWDRGRRRAQYLRTGRAVN